MRRHKLLWTGILCGVVGSLSALTREGMGQTVHITDSSFLDGNWVHAFRPDSALGTQTVTRQVTADDPSGFQQGVHNCSVGTTRSAHFLTASTYDPSTMGPISTMGFDFDFRMIDASSSIKTCQAGLLLRQAGQTYAHPVLATFNVDPAWGAVSSTNTAAADFGLVTATGVDSSIHPDFSCTGGTVEFGYTVINSSNKSGNTITWNVDNFSITIQRPGFADCNGNGVSDYCDLVTGVSGDCDSNSLPDDCEPDCNGNEVPDLWYPGHLRLGPSNGH
jgi:hypothetical protein